MYKFFLSVLLLFTFTFMGCENDRVPPEDPPPPQEPVPQGGVEQPGAETTTGDQTTTETEAAREVSDEDLERYVDAIYQAEVEGIDPQLEIEEMELIVDDVGLQMQEYMDIRRTVEQDSQLQQRVNEKLDERRQEDTGF